MEPGRSIPSQCMADAPATCKCGAPANPRNPERCTRGHCLPGYRGPAWRHGVKSFEARGPEALPQELRTSVDGFRDALVADRGGLENTTTIERGYINRLVEIETVARLTAADLAQRGLVRGTFDRWATSCELWDRYARRLGMDRKARHIDTLESLAEDIVAARREVQ
jgi:hypothetical protein